MKFMVMRSLQRSNASLALFTRGRTMRFCWSSMCFLAKSTSCFAVTARSFIRRQRLRN
jgi:hypothetical protein